MRIHDPAHDWNQMHRRFRLVPPIQLYQIEADCWRCPRCRGLWRRYADNQ